MFLNQFEEMESICIQCHDGPDADTIVPVLRCMIILKKREKEFH